MLLYGASLLNKFHIYPNKSHINQTKKVSSSSVTEDVQDALVTGGVWYEASDQSFEKMFLYLFFKNLFQLTWSTMCDFLDFGLT